MIVAIIPARSGSKRIPQKNIINFFGKPLISYSIIAAKKTKIFDKIIVSTDSDKIGSIAKKYGAEYLFKRPKKLSGDQIPTSSVVKHAINYLKKENQEPNFICCIYPTAPLILPQDLINSYNCGLCMHGKSIDLVANELDLAMKNHKWLQLAGDTAKKLALKFFDREELSKQLEKILITTKNDKPELAENIARGIYI